MQKVIQIQNELENLAAKYDLNFKVSLTGTLSNKDCQHVIINATFESVIDVETKVGERKKLRK